LELERQQLKALEAGDYVDKLGDLNTPLSEAVEEATKFVAHCYGSRSENQDMSEITVEVWSRKM